MISESFVKGQKQSVIYYFIPNVPPGYKITKTKLDITLRTVQNI